jgi:hypothetical protein
MVRTFFRKSFNRKAKKTRKLRSIKKPSPFIYESQFKHIMSTAYNVNEDEREKRMDEWNSTKTYAEIQNIVKEILFDEQHDNYNLINRITEAYIMSHNKEEFGKKILSQPRNIKQFLFNSPEQFQRLLWLETALFYPDGIKRYHDDETKVSAIIHATRERGYELAPDDAIELAEMYSANAREDRWKNAFELRDDNIW